MTEYTQADFDAESLEDQLLMLSRTSTAPTEVCALMDKAAQRIKRLEAGLRPFAMEAASWADRVSNSYRPGVTEPRQHQSYSKAAFSIGDCRRAARLLKQS